MMWKTGAWRDSRVVHGLDSNPGRVKLGHVGFGWAWPFRVRSAFWENLVGKVWPRQKGCTIN